MAAILRVKDENGNIVSIPAIKGDKGEKGDRGLPGSGGVPDGGTTGQVLTKNSNADGDAGWNTPEPFVINSGVHYDQLFVNKSYAEIKEAYEFGKNVVIIWNNKQYPLSSISDEKVEFIVEESITNSDDYTMYNIHTRTLAIYSESGKRATKDYTNLSVYSIKGSDESFAPKASAVLTIEQTLTTEQQSQALANIGGLSKNQGTANSGKFLGIGADGAVVPMEVSGGEYEWRKIKDISVTSEDGVTWINVTEDSDGNSLALDEVFVLIKSESKQYAYAQITISNGSQRATVGEYRLANEAENSPGVIRIRPFGPYWMATYMSGGYSAHTVDQNWGFYYQKSQPLLSVIPKITGIGMGFSTLNAEVWGR